MKSRRKLATTKIFTSARPCPWMTMIFADRRDPLRFPADNSNHRNLYGGATVPREELALHSPGPRILVFA